MILLVIMGVIAIALYLTSQAQAEDTPEDLGGILDTSNSNNVVKIAEAIAAAEGFYVKGSRPQRNNNPGDMTKDLIGRAIAWDGAYPKYSVASDGWANLYAQINAWLNGTSRYHNAQSTIADLAGLGTEPGYTSTDKEAWANNVAGFLGVGTDTPIGEIR